MKKKKIIEFVYNEFKKHFEKSPDILIKSPGRVNLIGEHTDYNGGLAMPFSINKYIFIAFGLNQLKRIRIYSADFKAKYEFDLQNISPQKKGNFENYILGVYQEIKTCCNIDQGFDMVIKGNIPIGAGLSSSAALSCGVALALNHTLKLQLPRIDLVKIAQNAEHNFAGVACGILDQMAVLLGKKNKALLINCKTNAYEYISFDSEKNNYFLINSNVAHALENSAYNNRVRVCKNAVEKCQKFNSLITTVSDIKAEDLIENKVLFTSEENQFSAYILEENQRVKNVKTDLEHSNYKSIGKTLYDCHYGLKNQYKVTCNEVDYIVAQSKLNPDIYGGRMIGGGFGGCVLFISKKDSNINTFYESLAENYTRKFGFTPQFIAFKSSKGTSII